MRIVTLIALILLTASLATAGEKVPEADVPMPDLDGRGIITGTLDASSPTWNRSYGGGAFVGDCNQSMTDSSSDGQYYTYFCITSTDDQPIEIVVDADLTTINDTTMYLFCDPFDPADSLSNVNFYDDDGGTGLYSAFLLADNVVLTPGTDYFLVLSTFSPGDMGDFHIDTSMNVVECGTVANENIEWGSLKTIYQ